MTDKLTAYKAELLELQQQLKGSKESLEIVNEYTGNSTTMYITKQTVLNSIAVLESRIELLVCQIDSIEDHNHNLTVALQQLSDARVSLYRAYHLGIDIDVAENKLIAVREQYNAIHGV